MEEGREYVPAGRPPQRRTGTDYWAAVSAAFQVVGRYRFLWFYGFFAASGGGGSGGGNWSEDAGPWVRDFFMQRIELLVLIILGIILLALILIVMSVISRGALIGSAAEAASGGRPTFRGAWKTGLRYALPIFGLAILSFIVVLLVTVVCIIPVVLPLAAGSAGIAIAIVIAVILFLPYLAFLIAVTLTVTYAERAIVVDGMQFIDAIGEGWRLLRSRMGESFVYWLIGLLAGIVFTVGIIFILVVVATPLVVLGTQNLVAALAIGIPLAFVIMAFANGIFGTYIYSYWTFAYLALREESVA
jgi:hypothetical protein